MDIKWHPEQLEDHVRATMLNNLQVASDYVKMESKSIVPVKTGNLRDSIETLEEDLTGDMPSIYIGSELNYAIFVELGTSKMSPKPYLRPPIDSIELAETLAKG